MPLTYFKTLFLGDFGRSAWFLGDFGMQVSDIFKHFQASNSSVIMIQDLYLKNTFSKYTSLRSEFRNEGLQALDSHQRISLTPVNNCVYDENITWLQYRMWNIIRTIINFKVVHLPFSSTESSIVVFKKHCDVTS